MEFVKVVGGWINSSHVFAATRHEWDLPGHVSLQLTNGDTVPVLEEKLEDFNLVKAGENSWVNPEHVSVVRLTLNRGKMYADRRDNRALPSDDDYKCVELIIDVDRTKISFYVDGKTQADVEMWVERLLRV